MDFETFYIKIKDIQKLVAFDHIVEGYGFKNEKDLFKDNWLPKDFMKDLKKSLENSKKEIKEVIDFINDKLTEQHAKEAIQLIFPNQSKFSNFKFNHGLNINIFVQSEYINNMEVFSEELFFPNELIILKKIQEKANVKVIIPMTHEDVIEQYQKISNIMNPNPIVTLQYIDTTKKSKKYKKYKK